MWADRERAERRLNALVADFLDSRGADSGDDELELGVIAIVVEVKGRKEPDDIKRMLDSRTRPEVEYTPEAEWWHNVWYRCSDSRDWIASGLFRLAMKVADGDYDDDEDDDESDE
jgi:hypothetical protein